MMTDPIADMLTRIRNANRIERPAVEMPTTRLKEVTVGHLGRGSIRAEEDVYPIAILPEQSDLHLEQAGRPAQGVEYLLCDERIQFVPFVLLHVFFLLALLSRLHCRTPGS